MQYLTIDPPIPYLLPTTAQVAIVQIGCGGTGSFLAQAIARLAVHCRDHGGPHLAVTLIDGDQVEPKNVGRQAFGAADVGRNKAQVLAARLNALFGLQINAIPRMLTDQRLGVEGDGVNLLVGCVDTARGRRAIAAQLEPLSGRMSPWHLWLDCGNECWSGQVVVGSALSGRALHGALALRTVCTALPAPCLVYPNLLEDAPAPEQPTDCATAVQAGEQGLFVNQTVANIAAQYLYGMVVERRLLTYRTAIDLRTMVMGSKQITAAHLQADTDVVAERLYEQTKGNG
jgi:PRTRC genetic system ThiF family protein